MANINFKCEQAIKDRLDALTEYYNLSETAVIKMLITKEFNDKRLDKVPSKEQLEQEFHD